MNNWTNVYDEITTFYFYEPNHLGKMGYKRLTPPKNQKYANEAAMREHISNMEVSLNHLFSILLAISPNMLTKLITKKVFGVNLADDYFLDQVDVAAVNKLMGDATQPDAVITGTNNRIMIEMKTGTKTSLDQYCKYLLFAHFMDEEFGQKTNFIIYLAKSSMEKTWKEKLYTQADIKRAFKCYEMPAISRKGHINIKSIKEELIALSDKISIGFISYQELFDILEQEIYKNPGNEILHNLYRGFCDELLKRSLAEQGV